MSSSKTFVIGVKPRDVLVDIKGLPDYATNAYLRFWMLHALHGEPLPPREEKKPREEWDAWFRDKLDMKNVRTWIKARDELLRLSKIRMADDGRLYIGRTMRDAEKRRGGDPSRWSGEDDGQGTLKLAGEHWAQTAEGRAVHGPVEKPVDDPGELSTSAEDRPKFARTSAEVRPIRLPKPLIFQGRRAAYSCSWSKSDHEVVAAVPFAAPRARAGPPPGPGEPDADTGMRLSGLNFGARSGTWTARSWSWRPTSAKRSNGEAKPTSVTPGRASSRSRRRSRSSRRRSATIGSR